MAVISPDTPAAPDPGEDPGNRGRWKKKVAIWLTLQVLSSLFRRLMNQILDGNGPTW